MSVFLSQTPGPFLFFFFVLYFQSLPLSLDHKLQEEWEPILLPDPQTHNVCWFSSTGILEEILVE